MADLMTRRRHPTAMTRFQDDVNNLFSRFFESFEPMLGLEGTWTPVLDVAETDNEFMVKAELPGMKAQDIEVTVRDNNLVISGEKKETEERKEQNWYHVERRYGSFYRTIPLPSNVDAEKIQATCQDGILSIRLPKTEAVKPRKIEVKGE